LGTGTSPFRFLYLSQRLGFRGSATAIDIIAHDTDHWLGFYDRAATAYRLRLYQDRCHVYNDLHLSQRLGFRGSATAIDIIAHDTDHWLGFYDRAATAYRLRLYQDRCHVYNDLRYDGRLYQGSTRGVPRADVRTGTSSASGSIAASGGATIAMSDYCFFPSVYASASIEMRSQVATSSGTTGRFMLVNQSGSSKSYTVRWRYIAS